jgi:hypothetical protein
MPAAQCDDVVVVSISTKSIEQCRHHTKSGTGYRKFDSDVMVVATSNSPLF